MSNKEAAILEQRRVISWLESELATIEGKYRGLQGSYFALQRNFDFLVDDHAREIEKINIERDGTLVQLIALRSSVEGSKSRRLADVVKLIENNESLTAENADIKNRLGLFERHLEDWEAAFLALEIYSRGLESLLHIRGFSRVAMPSRPSPLFDVGVKRELEEPLHAL